MSNAGGSPETIELKWGVRSGAGAVEVQKMDEDCGVGRAVW